MTTSTAPSTPLFEVQQINAFDYVGLIPGLNTCVGLMKFAYGIGETVQSIFTEVMLNYSNPPEAARIQEKHHIQQKRGDGIQLVIQGLFQAIPLVGSLIAYDNLRTKEKFAEIALRQREVVAALNNQIQVLETEVRVIQFSRLPGIQIVNMSPTGLDTPTESSADEVGEDDESTLRSSDIDAGRSPVTTPEYAGTPEQVDTPRHVATREEVATSEELETPTLEIPDSALEIPATATTAETLVDAAENNK